MDNNTVVLSSFDCSENISPFVHRTNNGGPNCNAVHDGIICWPATPPGIKIAQHCPRLAGFDTSKFVYRKCDQNGLWEHFNSSFVVIEKTNYEACVQAVANNMPADNLEHLAQVEDVIRKTSILGVVCIALSLISVIISIVIYKCGLPKYMNDILRVKIHKHLFAVVSFEMLLKLVFHVSIYLSVNYSMTIWYNQLFICEFLTTINQYLETTVLMWVVIDCHFIHITARSGFLCISGYLTYIIIGWGTPMIPTLLWTMTLLMSHKVTCWQGHINLPSIWIVEVPKILCFVAIIVLIWLSSYRHYQTVSHRLIQDSKVINDLTTTGILFLLMLTSFLMVLIPTHIQIDNLQHRIVVQYFATVLTSSKGIYVAFLCTYSNIKDYVKAETTNADMELDIT